VITSIRNPKVAAALRLHKRAFRERERAFLVEGVQALDEALSMSRGSLSTLFHTVPSHDLVERAREAAGAAADVEDAPAAQIALGHEDVDQLPPVLVDRSQPIVVLRKRAEVRRAPNAHQ